MDYLHVNADCKNGDSFPIVMKASQKVYDIAKRMVKITKQHRELEKKFIDELAKINNMSTDEVSDIMSTYDFMVDAAEYGVNVSLYKEITADEYELLVRKAIEEGSMEFNEDYVQKIKRIDRKQKMHSLHNKGKVQRKHG